MGGLFGVTMELNESLPQGLLKQAGHMKGHGRMVESPEQRLQRSDNVRMHASQTRNAVTESQGRFEIMSILTSSLKSNVNVMLGVRQDHSRTMCNYRIVIKADVTYLRSRHFIAASIYFLAVHFAEESILI